MYLTSVGQFLDWSSQDQIAVSLAGRRVYTWSASGGEVRQLELEEEECCHVTAVAWNPQGTTLATAEECGLVRVSIYTR